MWKAFLEQDKSKMRLYFDSVKFIEHKHTFVFYTETDEEYHVIIDGNIHACRLTNESYALSYNDKYITKRDINKTISKSIICYAEKSEYIDWFVATSCMKWETALYHFYVESEEYLVEFITDEMPKFMKVEK